MSTAGYLYSGSQRLVTAKPYSFAPCGGETFLKDYADSRGQVEDLLMQSRKSLNIAESDFWVEAWLEHVEAMKIEPVPQTDGDDLANMMEQQHRAWEEGVEQGTISSAEPIDGILLPFLATWTTIVPSDGQSAWGYDTLGILLKKFEAFGRVFSWYDKQWKKAGRQSNEQAVVIRLSAGAAWMSLGNLRDNRPESLAQLNVLLKLNDLSSAGMLHGAWDPDQREIALFLGALRIERQLVARWNQMHGLEWRP